jgi:predicted AlkP superfamily phosphohydrolase/phosphomutase
MIELLVVGLDGATFRIIEPLCDEGKLPTLKKLISEGVRGTLESTFPPVTGPAWAAFATGKNPGKTGVFDFLNRPSEDSLVAKVMNSADIRRSGPYWDYLSYAGLEVGVVNYPLLYPPYAINGIMVSGLGSDPREEICYPKAFKQALLKKCGHYRIGIPWRDRKYQVNPSLFLDDLVELLEVNRKTLELLLDTSTEVLTFVISAADFAQHYMWKYIDPSHPLYQKEEAHKYGEAFAGIWQRIDEILDLALGALPQNGRIIIASDHGFGPCLSSFCTNSWLQEQGYLRRRTTIARLRKLQRILPKLLGRLSPSVSTRLFLASRRGRVPKIPAVSEIDMRRSLALAPIHSNIVGQIYLNRQAYLLKDGCAGLDEIKEEIVAKLEETCRTLGLRIRVFSRDELYNGKYVNLAPDLLFEIDDFECSVQCGFDQKTYRKPPFRLAKTGAHKRDGIFIAYGVDIRRAAEIEGATIYDIAPTILHMSGLPVPSDTDGRVLKEIFKEGSDPARRDVIYQEVDAERNRVGSRIKKLKESGKL